MRDKWIETLANIKGLRDTTLIQALHWLAWGVLKKEGYQWEVRRTGELKIGYWRKSFRSKNQRSAYPKRFVLIPGFGDTALSWYMVLGFLRPILKQNFDEIVLIDLPGFGGFLSKERTFPTMDLLLSHMGDILDYLKPHTILGHSLGGWLTGHYAAQCGVGTRPIANKLNYAGPDTIILANASGVYEDENSKQTMAKLFKESQKAGFKVLRPHLFAKEPAWFKFIVGHFEKFSIREDVGLFIDSVRDDHLLEKVATQIQAKVWLIWGESDTLVPVSCSMAWLKHLNQELKHNHHAILIRKAGHSPQLEQPAVTAVILAQILSQKIPHRFGRRWWTVVKEATQITGMVLCLVSSISFGAASVFASSQTLQGKKCEIWVDEQEIPHLYAEEENTGIACLGYVHGRDRIWQMDFFKKIASGKRAESFGKGSIQSDFLMRLLNLPERANQLLQQMSSKERAWLEAYTEGVNRGFQEALQKGVYEFQNLGYQPDVWYPEDTLTLILLQAFDQTQQSFLSQRFEQAQKDESHESSLSLVSTEELPWETTILKEGEYPKKEKIQDTSSKLQKTSSYRSSPAKSDEEVNSLFPDFWGGIGKGSNNWVIAPQKSVSGHAWLANDPHLRLTHPPFWKWVHLNAGPIDVIGATLPGLPVVVSGSNRHVSWGLTNSYLTVARLSFVPEEELKDVQVVRPWIWFKFWKFKIPFFFKTFRRTKEGFPVLPLPSPPGRAMVLRWSGFDLKTEDFLGFFELMKSRTAQDADLALSRILVPSWNFVFADDQGTIGYRAVGRIPRFTQDPAPGISESSMAEVIRSQEFNQPMSPEEIPHLMNPKRGFIASANNKQWPPDSQLSSGHAQDVSFRAFRIEELLTQKTKHDLESQRKIQCDVYATDARFILPELLKTLSSHYSQEKSETGNEKRSIQALSSWDFETDLECEACAIYRLWVKKLISKEVNYKSASLYRDLIQKKNQADFQNRVYEAFNQTLKDLGIAELAPDQGLPKWKALHLNFFHHLAGEDYFATQPIATPGDDQTVNPGSLQWTGRYFDHFAGASERLIVELSTPPKVYSVLAGSNEDIANRNLNDPESAWQKWRKCEQVRRHFPLDRKDVKMPVISVIF
jgi:penicillin amidase